MLRYLDISDTYLGKSRGHPSDMSSGVIAVGEMVGASGAAVMGAITLAYDIYCSFADSVDINSQGWDQPVYAIMGCVLGAGRLLGLDREQMGHALALALAPNMALGQSRQGELSSWKGCAGPNASRNGVFAALLARDGFTGPSAVFEGSGGLFEIVGRFDWVLPTHDHLIGKTHMKTLPVCYHGQAGVLAAYALRPKVKIEDIEEIHAEAYKASHVMMGVEANRWQPDTRETADHSMPYVLSIALLDGRISSASYSAQRLADPAVRALMRKVKVSENPEYTAAYPEAAPNSVTIRLKSGEVLREEVRYPKGHAKNPPSDTEVGEKFVAVYADRGRKTDGERVLKSLWDFDRAPRVSDMIRLLKF